PVVQKFITAYKSRYGNEPDFLAAQAFDAATIAFAAFERHLRDGISVEEALNRVETYNGLTGVVRVSHTGEIEREFSVVQLKRGRRFELTETTSAPIILRGNQRIEDKAEADSLTIER